MANVVVGLWSRPTKNKHDLNSETLSHMIRAIVQTKVSADSRVRSSVNLTSIFVAPEFLFTRPEKYRASVQTSAMPRDARDDLLAQIKGVASTCRKMLIVPGTIVFKEQFTETSIKRAISRLENATAPGLKPGSKSMPLKTYNTWEALQEKYEHLDATEGSKAVYRDQIADLTVAEKNLVLRQPVMIERSFLIKNRTYIYFDGERKFSYGRKCNADDFKSEAVKGIFVPGKKAGITTVAGRKVGFEICADHSAGVLKDCTSAADLDLQIICSAEVPNNLGNMRVKKNGYTLHASSESEHTKVLKRTGGIDFEEVKPFDSKEVDDGELRLYEIDV